MLFSVGAGRAVFEPGHPGAGAAAPDDMGAGLTRALLAILTASGHSGCRGPG
ncbi:hypothetical protein [Pseudonocardia acidicola]|uniref:Uncharacterized protein n=1 Tax=Pseudonocardia acidicola TaxID=2724939 RepID=A0ABX1SG50_9PSEU|nr:hypothetical protein [Pseudonocardia acidicola]NMI00066.1 hypothetical protein [Pseudonocardia acidicola]